jgi:tRNA threonylcarbamoyladenosine biosynthesis protein TsaE
MKLVVDTSAAMEQLGAVLAGVARAGDVIVLTGELGAGKTTLARGMGDAMELETPVSSPTFIVARHHRSHNPERPPLVHLDAYRLGSSAELDELDIDVEHSIVLAEWAAEYAQALSNQWLEIGVQRPIGGAEDVESDQPREVSISVHGEQNDMLARFGAALEGFRVSRG